MLEFIERPNQEIKLVSNAGYERYTTADFNLFFQNFEKFFLKKPIYGLLIKKYTDHIIDIPIGKTSEIFQAIKERISLYTKDIKEARFEEIYLYNRRDKLVFSIDYTNLYLHNYYTFYEYLQLNGLIFSEFEKKKDDFFKISNKYLRDKLFSNQLKYSEEEKQIYQQYLKDLKYKILRANLIKGKTEEYLKTYHYWLTLPIEYA